IGVNLVTAVLTALDGEKARARLISLLRTALGHDFAAVMLREFIGREILSRIASEMDADDRELRATAVASQIVGLFVVRYGVRVEPLASAPIDEVARRIGPVIQWHLTGFPGPIGTALPTDSEKSLDSGDSTGE